MGWFPLVVDTDKPTWSFDIVGLLAVVGGSSIEKHAQAITASPLGGFPRLLPAPETMLNTDRPVRLPAIKDVTVLGVHSGTHFNELNFFAEVIHGIDSLQPYEFQHFRIKHKSGVIQRDADQKQAELDAGKKDEEEHGEKNKKKTNAPIMASIPLHTFCPLNIVTLASILITIALFVWAGVNHDAVALIGLGTMSLSTSTACLSSQWRPKLAVRTSNAKVIPRGDIIIRSRAGAFVFVECDEFVSREIYGGTEVCDYVFKGVLHQILLGCSTILLMASIIFFSNSGWKMQIAVGLAYVILNIAYWAMALLTEPGDTWNMEDRYDIEKANKPKMTENFTLAMWEAIQATKEIEWLRRAKIAPGTQNWDKWLEEAKENCHDPNWPAEAQRNYWMAQKNL
ncbi:hypothetical protein PENANT_c011G05669 [Penicillium antarcticum]|uniref:Uncharacterized protein n=1 Tax=Penicillium antarcticum TaxID=416450 RepID=A0A1V6Q7A6_9EURO|nr:hypothetical protein PENANT_c011G05669 [Penicillium antarcticum]